MRLVRERERARITGIPKSTWYRLRARGVPVPEAVPIAGMTQAVAWVEAELHEFNRRQVERAREAPSLTIR